MKRLTLIRHAHADDKPPGGSDFDRPLSTRGLREAGALARYLLERALLPDLLIASTARRTQQTAEILMQVLALPAQRVQPVQQLYLASADVLLHAVRDVQPEVAHLAIVAHNPGVSDLMHALLPEDVELGELVTAGACTLTFDVNSWSDLRSSATGYASYPG